VPVHKLRSSALIKSAIMAMFASGGQLQNFARLGGECEESIDEKRGHNAAQSQ
jgi:hypothetical protein